MRAITTETIKVNSDDQASGWKQQIPTLAYLNKKRGGGIYWKGVEMFTEFLGSLENQALREGTQDHSQNPTTGKI